MKKFFLVIASAAILSLNANAEEYFAPGWFIGIKGGAQYTVGESSFGTLISPTAAINVGYQFRPWVGLRADISGWQGKGANIVAGADPVGTHADGIQHLVVLIYDRVCIDGNTIDYVYPHTGILQKLVLVIFPECITCKGVLFVESENLVNGLVVRQILRNYMKDTVLAAYVLLLEGCAPDFRRCHCRLFVIEHTE